MAAASQDGDPNETPKTERNDALTDAREALHRVPELSEDRMSEIKDRIKQGYYSRSDVLDRIVKRLTRHLTE